MPPKLEQLQKWMQALVVDPRPAREAIRARAVREHLDVTEERAADVVVASGSLAPLARVDIYGGMYVARLAEALAADYPVLEQFLGAHAFVELTQRYVHAHPSRHPNLSRLGAALPGFVARSRRLPERAFLADLARLEWAMAESFMAPESERLDARALGVVPAAEWGGVVLVVAPHVRVLALRHPANRYLQAVKDGQKPRVPRPDASAVAVYRKDDRVWRMALSPPMHAVLAAIVTGVPLGRAVARAPGSGESLTAWFGEWMGEGLFAGLLRHAPMAAAGPGRPAAVRKR